MGRWVVWIVTGALALVGAIVIGLSIGFNTGTLAVCNEAKEQPIVSPNGNDVVLVGLAECGPENAVTARLLLSDGGTFQIFQGSAPPSDAKMMAINWISATEVEVLFRVGVRVTFPTDGYRGMYGFGPVTVTYKEREFL